MILFLKKLLSCPVAMFAGIAGVSAFALAAALYSEVALGLEPCILCIYQRIPFVIGVIVGIVGLALRRNEGLSNILIGGLGVNFLVNAGIAFYHTGVEQKWWVSTVEGCAVPDFTDTSQQSILENILSAPTANCAEIPWEDPILGLSMANYNVLLGLGVFGVCVFSLILSRHAAT